MEQMCVDRHPSEAADVGSIKGAGLGCGQAVRFKTLAGVKLLTVLFPNIQSPFQYNLSWPKTPDLFSLSLSFPDSSLV